jgi:UDP-N-acetylglucosamine 2-epimerase (non-hydrolysing)
MTGSALGGSSLYRIDCVVGARPNFMKIAPILRALDASGRCSVRLIHTGQHYDQSMNAVFFEELGIRAPDFNLEIGPGTNTEQTARIMLGLEPQLLADRPALMLVVGDVNSTMAAALVAAKLLIPVAHVEAGLRSHDRTMPEEINRLVTDRLSDLLLTTELSAADQLASEGVPRKAIRFVGNVMIDTMYDNLARTRAPIEIMRQHGAPPEHVVGARDGYGFVTLHRPSNVDDPAQLAGLVDVLAEISLELPLVFAMHPRTRTRIEAAGLQGKLAWARVLVTPPLSYLEALGLMRGARLAISDSGGVQEETTALGVPCLTVRDNTERPVTVTEGTNTLVGSSPQALLAAVRSELRTEGKRGHVPELWDGRAAGRIVQHALAFLDRRQRASCVLPTDHNR